MIRYIIPSNHRDYCERKIFIGLEIIIYYQMSIEMMRQSSIELIIASVKEFKRAGEKIAQLVRQNKNQQALVLLQQSEKEVSNIQQSLRNCEEGYLNPDVAKKLMILRNQFIDERAKIAKLFHQVRVEQTQQASLVEQQVQEFDYQLQRKLLRQREESLLEVHSKFQNINNIMAEAQSQTLKQGEQLDIIGDNLEKSTQQMKESNNQLSQANELSKSHNKSCMWLILVALILATVILLVLLIFCSKYHSLYAILPSIKQHLPQALFFFSEKYEHFFERNHPVILEERVNHNEQSFFRESRRRETSP